MNALKHPSLEVSKKAEIGKSSNLVVVKKINPEIGKPSKTYHEENLGKINWSRAS